jgi:2,5-diamino-6-(ribosylamino)-4(3H)-pyrimidinone 5'-phosphate reductase
MKIPTRPLPEKRPFVFVNMAMSADGKITTANRAVSSFASRLDRHRMLLLRAQADAVMVGARTVESSPMTLGPGPEPYRKQRLKHGLGEYNLRVVATGSGSLNLEAEIFRHRFSPIIILTTEQTAATRLKRLEAIADQVHVCGSVRLNLPKALQWLHAKWNVNHLLCEGGGELNSGLFSAGLVDELHLTIVPRIFGGEKAPTICDGEGIEKLTDACELTLKSMKRAGDELFLVYSRPSSRIG